MTPWLYYSIGIYVAGILIIFRSFNKEYQENLKELKEKVPSERLFSSVILVVYLFLMIFSWLTVVWFILKRIKE
jgi:hypothetical protein